MTHPNGDVFTGTWRAGKRAQGTYTHADGSVYEGELKGSKLEGRGKFSCAAASQEWPIAAGETYEGEWKGSKWHGKGRKVCADGSVQEGRWEKNKFVGPSAARQ